MVIIFDGILSKNEELELLLSENNSNETYPRNLNMITVDVERSFSVLSTFLAPKRRSTLSRNIMGLVLAIMNKI